MPSRSPLRPNARSRRDVTVANRRRAVGGLALITTIAIAIVAGTLVRSSDGARHGSHPASSAGAPGKDLLAPPTVSDSARPRKRRSELSADLGEMIIARFAGTRPSRPLLRRVRSGMVGGVILFEESFAAGPEAVATAIASLQRAARAAGTWPLLVMTDQEGGEVRRAQDVAPVLSAREMTSPGLAEREGLATGQGLRRLGINVDLAPVADVEEQPGSFLGSRAFGSNPELVANRACAFARGLRQAGIGYTLKHFPGLGSAPGNTDLGPVTVETSSSKLRAGYSAYRACGRGRRALVMVSSARYPTLTGNNTPAVDAPSVYTQELASADVQAVTISDDLQAGALSAESQPAARAIGAGLDLLLYAQTESASNHAFQKLAAGLADGTIDASQVKRAAAAIRRLKSALPG
jgi:beta-N-acetylhexosaminidase